MTASVRVVSTGAGWDALVPIAEADARTAAAGLRNRLSRTEADTARRSREDSGLELDSQEGRECDARPSGLRQPSENSEAYRTKPAIPLSAPASSSIAMKASGGDGNSHVSPKVCAGTNPNLG